MAASENLKLACLQFENHSTCDTQFLARCRPGFCRETPDHRLRLGQRYVLLEGVLGRYGLCRPVRDDFVVIDPSRQLVEAYAITTKAIFERSKRRPIVIPVVMEV